MQFVCTTDKMDRILKEVATAKSNVLYQNLLGETDKNTQKTCQDLQSPTQDSNQVPHKYKSTVLPLQQPTLYRVKNSVEAGEMSQKIWWDVCIYVYVAWQFSTGLEK